MEKRTKNVLKIFIAGIIPLCAVIFSLAVGNHQWLQNINNKNGIPAFTNDPFTNDPESLSKDDQGRPRISVGVLPIIDSLQAFVAKEKEYFNEVDLNVRLNYSLEERRPSHMGIFAISPTLINNDRNNSPRILFPAAFRDSSRPQQTRSEGLGNFLVTSKDISNPKDLEDEQIAVEAKEEINELILKTWADKNGVDIKEEDLIEMPFGEMESALKEKTIKGAIVEEPYKTLIVNHGAGKVLDNKPFQAINDRILLAGWFTSKKLAQENKEVANAFRKAIKKATNYINSNPEELPDIIAEYTNIEKEVANEITLPAFETEIKKEDMQPLLDKAYEYDLIREKTNAEELIWNRNLQ